MTISVFVGEKGRHLMERVEVIGKVDTLHEIVRLAYMDAQSYLDADLIVKLVDGLRPICKLLLLPKTRLLLALVPFVALRKFHDQRAK
jgi:hypothetical protein